MPDDIFSDPATFTSLPWPVQRDLMLDKFHNDCAAAGLPAPRSLHASGPAAPPDPWAAALKARAAQHPRRDDAARSDVQETVTASRDLLRFAVTAWRES